jgi:hypothetical protein
MSKLWASSDPQLWAEALECYDAVLQATGNAKLQELER